MSICVVNGQNYDVPVDLKTWGQLLEALERGADDARIVVTAVRFGGVDVASFRDPMLQTLELDTHGPIDVDMCPGAVLVKEAIDTALSGIDALAVAIQHAAEAFRCHDLSDANSRLAELASTLQNLTALTEAISQSESAPDSRCGTDKTVLLAALNQGLEALVDAATSEDWISVADVLEYDLTDLLPAWRAVLQDRIPAAAH
jgi:hypothetical protein